MSSKWDSTGIAFQSKTWAALSEHLLPGAFIFVFGSSRGWHRLAVAIEDAGFVFHPSLMVWGALQGQGFPKSTRIDTQIDKAAGAEREVVGTWKPQGTARPAKGSKGHHGKMTTGSMAPIDYDDVELDITAPATDLARAWEGHRYGRQALKPAVEMIICAQKPYEGKPVDSIVETGAGALNIEKARVTTATGDYEHSGGHDGGADPGSGGTMGSGWHSKMTQQPPNSAGRWPPNFCLVHVPPHICATCNGDGCETCNETGLVGGCQRAGTKRVKSQNPEYRGEGKGASRDSNSTSLQLGIGPRPGDTGIGYAAPDGTEEVAAWACTENCAARRIGEQGIAAGVHGAGHKKDSKMRLTTNQNIRFKGKVGTSGARVGDEGTCARFFPQFDWNAEVAERLANSDQVFYASKASRKERDAGLENLPLHGPNEVYGNGMNTATKYDPELHTPEGVSKRPGRRNNHPCVKNISLCRWLATLLLPPPEYAPRRILVPFAGVASEMIAAILAGWEFVQGIEMDEEYCAIGEARLKFWSQFSSYEAAMDAARNIQQSHRKQEAQAQSGQLKLTL